MRLSVRPAMPADAAAIAAVAEKNFGEAFDRDRIGKLLQAGQNYTLVARDDQRVQAFADNFITLSAAGEKRLELDLLAVEAKARGQGIGRRLIAESLMLARALDATLQRALVKSENLAMRRLCASAGFTRSVQNYSLYVAPPAQVSYAPQDVPGSLLVPVETFAYSGIWIEGALTEAAILQALALASARQMATVGALAACSDDAPSLLLADYGFRSLGTYDWWTLKLKNG